MKNKHRARRQHCPRAPRPQPRPGLRPGARALPLRGARARAWRGDYQGRCSPPQHARPPAGGCCSGAGSRRGAWPLPPRAERLAGKPQRQQWQAAAAAAAGAAARAAPRSSHPQLWRPASLAERAHEQERRAPAPAARAPALQRLRQGPAARKAPACAPRAAASSHCVSWHFDGGASGRRWPPPRPPRIAARVGVAARGERRAACPRPGLCPAPRAGTPAPRRAPERVSSSCSLLLPHVCRCAGAHVCTYVVFCARLRVCLFGGCVTPSPMCRRVWGGPRPRARGGAPPRVCPATSAVVARQGGGLRRRGARACEPKRPRRRPVARTALCSSLPQRRRPAPALELAAARAAADPGPPALRCRALGRAAGRGSSPAAWRAGKAAAGPLPCRASPTGARARVCCALQARHTPSVVGTQLLPVT